MKTLYRIIFPVLMLVVMSSSLKAQYVTNHAAKFNGTNSYVSLFTSPDLDYTNGYTIEAWVYYTHVPGKHSSIYLDTAGVYLGINNNGNVTFAYNRTATANLDSFPQQKWTHLTASYDGITAKVYYDGELKHSITSPGTLPGTSQIAFVGGQWFQGNVYKSFNGMLDDVRVWKKAKTSYEIHRDMYLSLAAMGGTGVYKDLGLSYRFDYPGGNAVHDEGGKDPNYGNTFNLTFEDYTLNTGEYSTFNSSLILDGPSAYCVAPPHQKLHAASSVTIEAWAKLGLNGPHSEVQEIAGKSNGSSYSYRMYLMYDSIAVFKVNAGTGYTIQAVIPGSPFDWNHFAGTYNGQTGEMKLYINGKVAASEFKTPAAISGAAGDSLYIGKSGLNSVTNSELNGQLDEIRIWAEKVRTANEIKSYMHIGINTKNDPEIEDAFVLGFDGRTDDASGSVNANIHHSLVFNGPAYMRSSRSNAPIYSASPLVWQAPGNFLDATWNLSDKSMTLPPSGVISDSIYYATDGTVQNPKVMVLLNSSNIHRVKIKLIAPDGTTVQLTPDHELGRVKCDLMTVFNDNAEKVIEYNEQSMAPFSPSFKPYQTLSALNGINRKGWWKLKMEIVDSGSESQLVKWGIQNSILTSQTGSGEIILNSYKLDQNFPNPFNPATKIKFELPADVTGLVKLSVYDITGREVAVLANGALKPGAYEYTWNAEGFSSGVYFYTLQSKGGTITKKMLLVK